MSRRSVAARTALWVCVGLVAAWLIAPTLVVIPLSFTDRASFVFPPQGWSLQWYENLVADPAWLRSLWASVRIAAVVMLLAVLLGTAAAFGIARLPRRLAGGAQLLLLSPLLAPQIVTAVAILAIFLRWRLSGTELGFVLAHLVLAIPYVVVTVSASLERYDRRLDQAAESLGATPLRRFFDVTVPSVAPGIATGAVFAFVTSFEETVIAVYLQSPTMRTLPVQMYDSVTVDIDPTIAAVSSLVLAITTAVLLVPLLGRRRADGRRTI